MARLRRWALLSTLWLAACATAPPPPSTPPSGWDTRAAQLQSLQKWQLDGRAAVTVGTQGWQASLNWREQGEDAEVHLAGPLGIGALVLKRTPAGLSLNGAPPSADVIAQLEGRLGFVLPLEHLRFWLLGVPDPKSAAELARNEQDRAAHLEQDGWSVDFERYVPVQDDVLPARLVLSRESVRVKIAIDQWSAMQ